MIESYKRHISNLSHELHRNTRFDQNLHKGDPNFAFFTVYESSQPDYRILNVVFRCYSKIIGRLYCRRFQTIHGEGKVTSDLHFGQNI